jgi:hypothetical protein
MDVTKITGKHLLILLGINVVASVIAGLIVYHLTKPKTDSTTTPPPVAKQGTTPTVTTVTSTVGEGV